MCEWNLLCDASSTPPNTCSGSSAFDFHSRMKSICVSFSWLPILYHRRREFGGCKFPFFSSFLLLQPYTIHCSAMFSFFAQQKHWNPRKQRSCIDVTGPLSPIPRLARFCTQPEVKLHVFDRQKRGEEKSIGSLFFRFPYENNTKIQSSK